jgi:hypothetical protein
VLRFKHVGEEPVLTFEVIIQRAFGQCRGISNIVHADPGESLPPKQHIGRIQNTLGIVGASVDVYRLVYLQCSVDCLKCKSLHLAGQSS